MKKIILRMVRHFLSACLKIKIAVKSKYLLPEERKKILLINLHGIGDIIMLTPAINLLRENYPLSEIDLLVSEPAAPLFKDDPQINNIFKFKNKKSFNSIRSIKKKYDTVLLFIGGIWGTIAALSINTKEIAGMALNTTLAAVWKDENSKMRVQQFNEKTHLSDLMINVVKLIAGTDKFNQEYTLYINYEDIDIEKFNLAKPYIVLAPETNWDIKNIKQQLIDELCNYYKGRGVSAIIIGSKNNSVSNKNDIRGKTTILEALKIIKESEYLISADSVFMHMAAAVEIPVLSLFGPTDPARIAPQGKCHVVRKDIFCSPCYKEIYIPKCINPEYNLCMKLSLDDIKVELELFEKEKACND